MSLVSEKLLRSFARESKSLGYDGARGCLTFWAGEKGRVSKGPFRLRKSSFLNNNKKATWRTRTEYANEIYLEIMDSRCPREYIHSTPRSRNFEKQKDKQATFNFTREFLLAWVNVSPASCKEGKLTCESYNKY